MKNLYIVGIRGIPAKHGGFETFAERLSVYLKEKGWKIFVYCQEDGTGKPWISHWQGIERIHIPVKNSGAFGTVLFDWKSILHAKEQNGLFLTLGYNTAIFNIFHRINGQTNIINMDGIEWKRNKWRLPAKLWFWLNERAGCWIGNHLIADHPKIKDHLITRTSSKKITMIPYGAEEIIEADESSLDLLNISKLNYSIVIARPEPENSILEIVRSFSKAPRNHKLVVLGNFTPSNNYHKKILESASGEVIFPGAIYEPRIINALRFYSRFYIHGHQVGGTNPSLVEALGASCAVIAHDNHFNRWVAGEYAAYFEDEQACCDIFDSLLGDGSALEQMKLGSHSQYTEFFKWNYILELYESLLTEWYPQGEGVIEKRANLNI